MDQRELYPSESKLRHPSESKLRHCTTSRELSDTKHEESKGKIETAKNTSHQGITGRPLPPKKIVIGHDARPYDVAFGTNPAGAVAVNTMLSPLAEMDAVALTAVPSAPYMVGYLQRITPYGQAVSVNHAGSRRKQASKGIAQGNRIAPMGLMGTLTRNKRRLDTIRGTNGMNI
jgi:hypothetical protein